MPDYSDAVCHEAGEAWLKKHHDHVLKLVAGEAQGIKPSGSDGRRPELWKSIHWRWFFDTRKSD